MFRGSWLLSHCGTRLMHLCVGVPNTLSSQLWRDVSRDECGHWFSTFSHLSTYGAGYYSYLYVLLHALCAPNAMRTALSLECGW